MKKNLPVIFLLLFAIITAAVPVQAAVIYETVSRQTISKDVTYEILRQVTENGMLDIHVLRAPLTDPNITFAPAVSNKSLGLRETTVALLSENGAIAGVNGDFFDMSGSFASAMGAEIINGRLASIDQEANAYNNSLAGFFINRDNNPIIEYLKSDIRFYTDSEATVYIKAINKITNMEQPVYLDQSVMADTQELDARFPGLVKIVVENGMITRLSAPGEGVALPENGFIIAMNSETAEEHIAKFRLGQPAEIRVSASIDLSTIQMGIGGGSRILLNGEAVSDGYVINGGSRNPRTAIGVSQDNKQLILMVVDGRSHSIGATQNEMASLLQRFGAYNAMNLDGGGSSTMAVREIGSDWLKAVNTFSEGSQRKVVNALGIFSNGAQGSMISIVIEPKGEVAFKDLPIFVDVYGLDEYYNRIELDRNQLAVNVNDPNGRWEGSYYYPARTGDIAFIAAYGNYAAEAIIESKELAQIIPSQTSLTMGEGGKKELSFTGKSNDGFTSPLSNLQYELFPSNLGFFENGLFTAGTLQKGYIKVGYGDVAAYVEVSIGYKQEQLTSFETPLSVYGLGYPETVSVHAAVRGEEFTDGSQALGLTYTFEQSEDGTQAAYAVFDPPIALPDNPQSLRLDVHGDESGHWLRARLRGADGQEATVDLAGEINWTGWKELTVGIPGNLKSPVTVERIYTAALSNQDTASHRIYLDNIHVTYLAKFGPIDIPSATEFKDRIQVDFASAPLVGYDLTLAGNLDMASENKPEDYRAQQQKALENFKENTARGLFAGSYDLEDDPGIKYYKYSPKYVFNTHDDTAIVQLTAAQGGLTATDPYQWGQFTTDILNSNTRQVIIQLDKNPLNFTYGKEYQLFHDVLKEIAATGRQIFVVSTEGLKNAVTVREGIRYINVGGLWKDEKTVNSDFKILRFRITNEGVAYGWQ